jgi:hypothetical protein
MSTFATTSSTRIGLVASKCRLGIASLSRGTWTSANGDGEEEFREEEFRLREEDCGERGDEHRGIEEDVSLQGNSNESCELIFGV